MTIVYILAGVVGSLLLLAIAIVVLVCKQRSRLNKLTNKALDYREKVHGMTVTSGGKGAYGFETDSGKGGIKNMMQMQRKKIAQPPPKKKIPRVPQPQPPRRNTPGEISSKTN